MIDIHSHVLPMVDDGAKSMSESALIFQGLAGIGYTRVVATPHWAVGMPDIASSIIEDVTKLANNSEIVLSVARECRIHLNLVEHVKRFDFLRIDGGSVVLVELPWGNAPSFTLSVFTGLLREGFRPVLVHPERHAQLFETGSPIDQLISAGVPVQVNISSFLGQHGIGPRDRAISLLKQGKVSMVSTDIHAASEIDDIVPAAHQLLGNLVGEEVSSILTTHNPHALLADQPLIDLSGGEIDFEVDTSWIETDGVAASIRKWLSNQFRLVGAQEKKQ